MIQKKITKQALVHHAVLDYFKHSDTKKVQEMITLIRDVAIDFVHSKEGADVIIRSLALGTVKDRKAIVKSVKTQVAQMCREQHAGLVILAIFDAVDDTKIVQKVVLSEYMKDAKNLLMDKFGRRPILHLLTPLSGRYFPPDVVSMFKGLHATLAETSKKSLADKRKELLDDISAGFLDVCAKNAEELILSRWSSEALGELLLRLPSDRSKALEAVAHVCCGKEASASVMNHDIGHRLIKRLVQSDLEGESALGRTSRLPLSGV